MLQIEFKVFLTTKLLFIKSQEVLCLLLTTVSPSWEVENYMPSPEFPSPKGQWEEYQALVMWGSYRQNADVSDDKLFFIGD